MKQTLKSVLIFVGYNLLYGMRGGIDNAAHLGGLLSGAALGAFIPRQAGQADSPAGMDLSIPMTSEGEDSSRFMFAGAALVCVLFFGFGYVRRAHNRTDNSGEAIESGAFQVEECGSQESPGGRGPGSRWKD